MKRLDITVPKANEKEVEEVLDKYCEDVASSDVEKEEEPYIQFQVTVESEDVDELIEEVKHIKDVDTGKLTVEILEQTARIKKGEQVESTSSQRSTQEMYSKALEFSQFDRNSWLLIALSAGIAEFGVMMQNVMVVVGAMVIAPLLGPFIAASFGLVIGDKRLIQNSAIHAGLGMVLAITIAFILPIPAATEVNALMELISKPTFITIPLSLFVGAAASLTFVTGNKEQLAGVAVAIALVPPAAVAGLALSLGNIAMFGNTMLVIITNMASLILAGSLTFKLVGVSPSTYYRKKVSEERLTQAIIVSIISIVLIGAFVGYLSYQNLQTDNLQGQTDEIVRELFGDKLLSQRILVDNNEVTVKVTVVNPDLTPEQLEIEIADRLPDEVVVEAEIIAVEGEQQ